MTTKVENKFLKVPENNFTIFLIRIKKVGVAESEYEFTFFEMTKQRFFATARRLVAGNTRVGTLPSSLRLCAFA